MSGWSSATGTPVPPWVWEFLRYFVVSAVGLAVDVSLLWALAEFAHYLVAATISFVAGAMVVYLLSTRWVFVKRRHGNRPSFEFSTFIAIGVVGLGVNDLVMYVGIEAIHLSLIQAKIAASGATFLTNFLLRKRMLF